MPFGAGARAVGALVVGLLSTQSRPAAVELRIRCPRTGDARVSLWVVGACPSAVEDLRPADVVPTVLRYELPIPVDWGGGRVSGQLSAVPSAAWPEVTAGGGSADAEPT